MLESRFGFLRRGVTDACLNLLGKRPCVNERLARYAISSENTRGQDLMTDVGMKSRQDDLHGRLLRSLTTSVLVTGSRVPKWT